jgi:hypothetical protein
LIFGAAIVCIAFIKKEVIGKKEIGGVALITIFFPFLFSLLIQARYGLSETAKKCVLNGDFPVSKFGYLVE